MEIWKSGSRLKGIRAIPLGCNLDSLLGSGVPAGIITEVYGPPASGKSNIAIQLTINAIRSGFRVAFIDPEGSFHLGRVEQMAGDDLDRVLENTTLLEPKSLDDQGDLIRRIVGRDYRVVICDPITYHYRLELDRADPFPANQELARQLALLSWHARIKNAVVLVTNQVYSDFRGGYEPLAREVLSYHAKVRVELGIEGEWRRARLVKHISRRTGGIVRFKITGSGLR